MLLHLYKVHQSSDFEVVGFRPVLSNLLAMGREHLILSFGAVGGRMGFWNGG
jgi:hypothetical protein